MLIDYASYHRQSMDAGDIDPSYSMLRYVAERFDLSLEQRYWLAWLYATCYCGPTVFYIYNEFPDFENVNEGRLERWWRENKHRLVFQTDRRWVYSRNQFADMFRSYRQIVGPVSQTMMFEQLKSKDAELNYKNCWEAFGKMYQFGRFAMFLYLEAVHVVTGFPMSPKTMNIADAESCRNGLAMAIGRQDLNTHGTSRRLTQSENRFLQHRFDALVSDMRTQDARNGVWNIETTLCAYKKYCYGKRHVGFYIDRQRGEIEAMTRKVPCGVEWQVLWDYRAETFDKRWLREQA
jgi:hypothetical protein